MVTTVTVTVLQKIFEEEKWIRIKGQGIHMVGHAVSVFEKLYPDFHFCWALECFIFANYL